MVILVKVSFTHPVILVVLFPLGDVIQSVFISVLMNCYELLPLLLLEYLLVHSEVVEIQASQPGVQWETLSFASPDE